MPKGRPVTKEKVITPKEETLPPDLTSDILPEYDEVVDGILGSEVAHPFDPTGLDEEMDDGIEKPEEDNDIGVEATEPDKKFDTASGLDTWKENPEDHDRNQQTIKKKMMRKGIMKNIVSSWREKMSFVSPHKRDAIYRQMVDYIMEKNDYLWLFLMSNFATEFVDTQAATIAEYLGVPIKELGNATTQDMVQFGIEEADTVKAYCAKYNLPFEWKSDDAKSN